MACRTAALGGHLDRCLDCGAAEPSYNSCRNRHCPKCQGQKQFEWLEARRRHLLSVDYFHCVFTLPEALRALAPRNEALIYDLLFRSAADTLLTLGRDPKQLGALLGFTSILHTWNRQLQYHPHVHCIVTGGGLSADQTRWVSSSPTFLFSVKVMSAVFRGKFIDGLRAAYTRGQLMLREGDGDVPQLFDALECNLRSQNWVVYAKKPFAGADQVLSYLGRYTHRVGLANHRLVDVTADHVTFATRGNQTVSVTPTEFITRFLRHVLPRSFVKIRHYGLWAAGNRAQLACALQLKPPPRGSAAVAEPEADPVPSEFETAAQLLICLHCGSSRVERQPARTPSRIHPGFHSPMNALPEPDG